MESLLVSCCAPTLAGKKVGNIFNYKKSDKDINKTTKFWNFQLNPLGIFVEVLRETDSTYLIYVFDKAKLSSLLQQSKVQNFLKSQGFRDFSIGGCLSTLKFKLSSDMDSFPHEIGLFLGYPLTDVIGFIFYQGKCYKKCGQWKVYGNVKTREELFQEFHHCKTCFLNMYNQGFDALEIIQKFRGGLYEKSSSGLLVRNR